MWIFTVEDAIFTFVINELNSEIPFSNFSVDDVKYHETEPNILKLLKKYNSLLEAEPDKFTMKIKAQAYSHIMLMKLCLCVIAFEVAKRNHKETEYHFSDYRIPINVEEVYKNFNSLSYKARRAMRVIYEYFLREKNKPTFFDHNYGHGNYQKYAERVYSNCKAMQVNLRKKEKDLQDRKDLLVAEIRQFYKRKEQIDNYIIEQKEI